MNNGLLGLDPGRAIGSPFDATLWEEGYSCVHARTASGVEAGGSTGPGTWDSQILNAIVTDEDENIIGFTPAGGVIVRAGKYRHHSFCGLNYCEGAIARVWNVQDNLILGSHNGFSGTNGRTDTCTMLMEDVFTLRGDRELRLQSQSSAGNGNGWARGLSMGIYAGGGDLYELHGVLELWRMADR